MVLSDTGLLDALSAERRIIPTHPHKLGTVFEALVGAVFIDRGYGQTRSVLERVFYPRIPDLIDTTWSDNPQPRLGTICQQVLHANVHHDHHGQIQTVRGQMVSVEVSISIPRRSRLVVQGEGPTKNEAKRATALEALRRLGMDPGNER